MQLTAMFCRIFIVTGIFLGSLTPVWAYRTPIVVELQFTGGKPYYRCNDKVGVTITVKNTSPDPVRINRGSIKNRRFFLHMRIIDPAGRLLIPRLDTPSDEVPDAPPLPFVEDPTDQKLVMAAPCETFMPGSVPEETPDLGKYYNFEQSGKYSAQVQLSIMEFKKDGVCNPKKYRWVGVVKSKTLSFFVDGRLPIQIRPDTWHFAWKAKDPGRNVVVRIPIPTGNTCKDFKKEIRLENMGGLKADAEKSNGMLKARFYGKQCIEKLKNVRPGDSFRVVISGNYVNGRLFCGSQRITIK